MDYACIIMRVKVRGGNDVAITVHECRSSKEHVFWTVDIPANEQRPCIIDMVPELPFSPQ